MNIAGRIMNSLSVYLEIFGNILLGVFIAGIVAMVVGIITMVATGWTGFTTGYKNHITCAGNEFVAGWKNQGYIIEEGVGSLIFKQPKTSLTKRLIESCPRLPLVS